MSVKLGVVMDPIGEINFNKDSSLAILLAAQARGWSLHYMEMGDLHVRDGVARAHSRPLSVFDSPSRWYELGEFEDRPLGELDVLLMRKDPPFDMQFVYSTYLLERAEAAGVLVVNKPGSIRDANEKYFTSWFPQCCPATLITQSKRDLHAFLREHEDIIIKPLDGMGGASIFRVTTTNPNTNVIFETLTDHEKRVAMAQRYVAEIVDGDKRLLMIDGEPLPYVLARMPGPGDIRGNLAAGATGVGRETTERDLWIAGQVGPVLKDKGLMFVGLDIIGDYLTEINVTSPTCIRELDGFYDLDIGGRLIEAIALKLKKA